MLKALKTPYGVAYIVLAALQLLLLSQYELFVDEAFYWLEGQDLAWSYAELPGWTAWVLAFSEWLFPHHPAFLRLLPWLAGLTLPWMALAITQLIHPQEKVSSQFGLIWALPLTAVVSVLALPDIWLLFFALLSTWLTLLALSKNQSRYFVALGLCLALGLNVHVRFWFFAFILACCCLGIYRHHTQKLLTISLPLSLLGLLPVLIFNIEHQFPLLNFQFKDRHPWSFQINHLWFFLVQMLICTPLVFVLWLQGLAKLSGWQALKKPQKMILLAALLHWLLYALLGFFSDTMRLNLHWPLLSYALVLAAIHWPQNVFFQAAKITGTVAHAAILLLLITWHFQSTTSPQKLRITQHAIGWEALAKHTEKLKLQHNKQNIIADQFMTTAQLAYHQQHNISTLQHPLNDKHGRSAQLAIMNLFHQGPADSTDLIVIEQTALKLTQQIDYFTQQCHNLGGLKWLSQLDIENGSKIFHFYEASDGICELPAFFYGDGQLSGWVVAAKGQIDHIKLTATQQHLNTQKGGLAGNDMFKDLDPEKYQLSYFSCPYCTPESYQVEVTYKNGQKQTSPRYYP